ncbi:hypothetical protein [Micromonospora sp. WMMD987]|uniref:hypothetical protein n=1 Tax=Micromonospora sp. WMMD987 TaxID=3016089 RepID=UPI00249B3565|nr:hypothetical protein [Micromonospora sp. WMMD987]WFE92816.1 hypothetical protein O7612_15375 [Micromonospora sp. WMMD987]
MRTPTTTHPTELLHRAAHALWTDGDLTTSRTHFDAAYRAAQATGDHHTRTLAVAGMGGLWVHEHRTTSDTTLLLHRLHHAIADTDPHTPLGIRLRARLAAEQDYRTATHTATLALLDQARATGDPVTLTETASLAHHCLLGPDHTRLRHELSQDALTAALATDRPGDLLVALLWRTVGQFLDTHPHAERSLAELHTHLTHHDHLAVSYVAHAIDVMLTIRAGTLTEALARAATCARRGTAAGDADTAGWYGAHLTTIAWYQGNLTDHLPMLRELAVSPTLSPVDHSYRAALAVASALAGHRREATAALARLHRHDLTTLPRSSSWLVTLHGIVEAAHLLDDGHLATEAYDLLAPYADRPMLASLAITCFGSTHHALGTAALTAGETDRAITHLHAAIQDNLSLGHLPATTLSRARLADALTRRAGPHDRREAERQRHLAHTDATELGITLPTPPAHRRTPHRPRIQCHRHGRHWQLALGHRTATIDDSVGVRYLATLLANPGHDIPAIELAGSAEPTTGHQPVLDDTAKRAYRRRLSDLDAAIDDADAAHDPHRAEQARTERQWLLDELATHTGLHGRDRTFTGNTERARIAVGKAIRRALDRITATDPVLGEHLRTTISTGTRCSYRPS